MPLHIDAARAAVARFAGAVKVVDLAGIAEACTSDVVWSVPGGSAISGESRGHVGVAALATTLRDFEYQIDLVALTFGPETAAVEIRGTGTHNGRSIDVAVVNVLGFHDGKVASVVTHFSDIDAVDAYFA